MSLAIVARLTHADPFHFTRQTFVAIQSMYELPVVTTRPIDQVPLSGDGSLSPIPGRHSNLMAIGVVPAATDRAIGVESDALSDSCLFATTGGPGKPLNQ